MASSNFHVLLPCNFQQSLVDGKTASSVPSPGRLLLLRATLILTCDFSRVWYSCFVGRHGDVSP